jgi:hypothetical protein
MLLVLTADPVPSAQLYICERRIQNSECFKRKQIKFNKVTWRYNEEVPIIRNVSQNFVFLQFSADLIWYWREHAESPVENNLDCVTSIYGIPDGNTSFITVGAYDKRWVHNIHCLISEILRWLIDMNCKTDLLFTELCGRY